MSSCHVGIYRTQRAGAGVEEGGGGGSSNSVCVHLTAKLDQIWGINPSFTITIRHLVYCTSFIPIYFSDTWKRSSLCNYLSGSQDRKKKKKWQSWWKRASAHNSASKYSAQSSNEFCNSPTHFNTHHPKIAHVRQNRTEQKNEIYSR